MNSIERVAVRFTTPTVYWIALLGLCAAYLQGGIDKAIDFNAAIGEMEHFGLAPAAPMAFAVIVLELGASLMILSGFYRWLGAVALAGFTLMATLIALRFWSRAVHGRECLLRTSRAGGWLPACRMARPVGACH